MRSALGSVEDARTWVLGQLRARRDELVGAIAARVRGDEFACAGEGDAEYVAGLHAAVVAVVDYALEEIGRGEERAGPIPQAASEQARRAARLGVSLDTVLRRYVVGHTLLERYVMEEIDRGGIRARGGAAGAAGNAGRDAGSCAGGGLRRVHGRAAPRAGLARAASRGAGEGGVLLDGAADGAAVQSPELDYALDGWHLGAIATGAGAARAVRELAAGTDRRLLSVPQGERSVWAWLGARERLSMADVERVLAGAAVGEGAVASEER